MSKFKGLVGGEHRCRALAQSGTSEREKGIKKMSIHLEEAGQCGLSEATQGKEDIILGGFHGPRY